MRMVKGLSFRKSVISQDGNYLIVCTTDKKNNKDGIAIYDAKNGSYISIMSSLVKNVELLIPVPANSNLVIIVSAVKCVIIDIRTRQKIRTIHQSDGNIMKSGKYVILPSPDYCIRLIDIRKIHSMNDWLSTVNDDKTNVICLFTENDEHACYYNISNRTLKIYRIADGIMIADFWLESDLTAIKSSSDGQHLFLATANRYFSVFSIADPVNSTSNNINGLFSNGKQPKIKTKTKQSFQKALRFVKVSAILNRSRQNSIINEDDEYQMNSLEYQSSVAD